MSYKEELLKQLAVLLKKRGCRKSKQTWTKRVDGLVLLLNIQNSQFSAEAYYINLGILIEPLNKDGKSACLTNCHIIERIPECDKGGNAFSAENIASIFDRWEEWYGTMDKLKDKAIKGSLPRQTWGTAWTYLTTYRG